MTVIITFGHPESGYQSVHESLVAAGLGRAMPRDRDILPPPMANQDFQAEQLYELAVDFFRANTSGNDWGWADAAAPSMLDFWKIFDSRIQFVLVYSAPEIAVARMLETMEATPENISDAITSWMTCNEEILGFYHSNPDRCLLMNSTSVTKEPTRFLARAMAKLGVRIEPNSTGYAQGTDISSTDFALVRVLVGDQHAAVALLRELESSADLDDSATFPEHAEKNSKAWQEYRLLVETRKSAIEERREQHKRATRLQSERASLETEFGRARIQINELTVQMNSSQSKLEAANSDIAQLQSTTAALTHENQALRRERQQLQQRLEEYIVKCAALETDCRRAHEQRDYCASFMRQQIISVVIDLRKTFEGDNWHDLEYDGRWAGPKHDSFIRMPALGPGNYQGILDVPACMAAEILHGMKLSLNGCMLTFSVEKNSFPTLVFFDFSTDLLVDQPIWEFQFRFPRLMSPADHGSADTRQLAMKIRCMMVDVASQ